MLSKYLINEVDLDKLTKGIFLPQFKERITFFIQWLFNSVAFVGLKVQVQDQPLFCRHQLYHARGPPGRPSWRFGLEMRFLPHVI